MTVPLKFYTWATPNGFKVSIFLELLGLPYEVTPINIQTNVQKEPWFTKLNPNGRIPTLHDPNTNVTISQTGAILRYLAETYDKSFKYSYKPGTPDYYKELEVLFFQTGENGPIQGQANHFTLYNKDNIEYGINRYKTDTKRIYGVFEEYLKRNEENLFLVGPHISTADVAFFPWARGLYRLDIHLEEWPLVKKWFDKLNALEAVQKGLQVPK